MCGVTGVVEGAPAPGLESRIRAMTAALAHRGPDGEGHWTGEGVALGHRRLAILDLSGAGAQPMHSPSGRFVLAFNGEIYNHMALREALAAEGAAPGWRGRSDTETLLAGIEAWGLDETLRRSAGMFALALWDRRERRLSLARDRMGEKPLYWGHAGGSFVFGSELKALRLHPGFAAGISREALMLYLRFGVVPAPWSIHPGAFKLEPGCILELDTGRPAAPRTRPLRPEEADGPLSIRRWWSLDAAVAAGLRDPLDDAGQGDALLAEALGAAVGRQMVADVPLGAFLSGGIDSSLIVALMQERSPRPVQTFTIGFEEAAFNEAPHAAAVARHLGTDHHEMTVTSAEAREVIPLLPDLYDEPFADSSQVPTHLVARAARGQVRVALSGDAGDELFGGYNRYFWGPRIWNRLAWLPHPARRLLGAGIAALPVAGWDALAGLAGRAGGPRVARAGDKAHRLAARLRHVATMDDLYRSLVTEWPDPARLIPGAPPEPRSALDDPLPAGLEDPAARMMVQDMRLYLPDDILHKVDRAAMGIGLETRAPFLDPEVVALALRMPLAQKIAGGQGKMALRRLLYTRVPRELIERPKAGFGIPVGDWLRGPLRPWAEELLAPALLARDGLLDPAPVRRAWAEHLSGRRDWASRLWPVLMLQAWRGRRG